MNYEDIAKLFDDLISEYDDIHEYYAYHGDSICLDGHFTVDQLINIALCMKSVQEIERYLDDIDKEKERAKAKD